MSIAIKVVLERIQSILIIQPCSEKEFWKIRYPKFEISRVQRNFVLISNLQKIKLLTSLKITKNKYSIFLSIWCFLFKYLISPNHFMLWGYTREHFIQTNTPRFKSLPFIYGCLGFYVFLSTLYRPVLQGLSLPFIYGCLGFYAFLSTLYRPILQGLSLPLIYGCLGFYVFLSTLYRPILQGLYLPLIYGCLGFYVFLSTQYRPILQGLSWPSQDSDYHSQHI